MSKELPKSINLLEPINPPEDLWEKVYEWLFSIGKYILVFVELSVLAVFFSRFIIDKKNNDLADEINTKVKTLSTSFFRQGELRYNNLHALIADLNTVTDNQSINSVVVSSIVDNIPSNVDLKSFSFSEDRVSMVFVTDSFENLRGFETALRNNPAYDDIRLNLSRSGSSDADIDFTISFKLAQLQPEATATPEASAGGSAETQTP